MSQDALTRFDRSTAVTPLEPGRYEALIDRGFWIINGPNGGYIAAILLRAMIDQVGDGARAPRSLTIHYLRPPAEGLAHVHTVVERTGRSLTTLSARMYQGDRLLCIAIGAFGNSRAGFEYVDRKMPNFPPPASCVKASDKLENPVELHRRYESRWAVGEPFAAGSDRALLGGYIRLEEPRIVDAIAVAAFADGFVPSVLTRAGVDRVLGPIPTVDLTIHFRTSLPLATARPSDFTAVEFRSTAAYQGFLEEDGEIWSTDGVLLAQSRQLALVG